MSASSSSEACTDFGSQDEALLASLGYKQEFKRDFSPLQVFGLGFSIIGVVPSVCSVLPYAIPYGGTVAMVWGWATCSFFLMFIALAVAEMSSSAPTSGGLYYWTFKYSPRKSRRLLAWIVGYTNTIAYVSGVAGVDWSCSVQIMAAVTMGSNFQFTPSVYQLYGVYIALLITHGLVASLATRVIARLQIVYVVINLALCAVIMAGLPAATPAEFKNTPAYAFGHFDNVTSWPNGFAFILSFLAPLWAVGGFDSSVHISEEARNANVAVPWGVICATGLGSALGWGINVALAFSMGTDLEAIIDSPIGQPVATIFFNSFGRSGTLVVWSFIILVQFMMGTSILTAASRQMFAFSRDGALPLSRVLYVMNKYTGTPVNCVWAVVIVAAALGLICLAGVAASGAVFTLAVIGQYVSLSIPIAARHLSDKVFTPGPFYLQTYSKPVALVAVVWMILMSVVLLFPPVPEAKPSDMNYSVVVLGGILTLSLIYYYFPVYGGVHWFKGPIATIRDQGSNDLRDDDDCDRKQDDASENVS